MASSTAIHRFLEPLSIDVDRSDELSRRFLANFTHLAANSRDQGGTNLRVGFVELHGNDREPSSRVQRPLERSWPIDNHLKNDNADSLFSWIGRCIADVVEEGCRIFRVPRDAALPLGVTFSFPMEQRSVSHALLMDMGKGFALPSGIDLGAHIERGYAESQGAGLPPIKVTAIANDAVSTLVSCIFSHGGTEHRRAAMALILGTGSNATVPLKLDLLHPSKRPQTVSVLPGERVAEAKIAVNTEWSINGTLPPMMEANLVTKWDAVLSSQNERPGFQPLEYMTAGRYLGELARIILVDYLVNVLRVAVGILPRKLLERESLTTTFLSHYKPLQPPSALLRKLRQQMPEDGESSSFVWTEELATAVYHIAKAIQVRASGIIAAAIVALLTLADELPEDGAAIADSSSPIRELDVGYTGGCIVHFQDYLVDCQHFLDQLLARRFGEDGRLRVVLSPCHDGGVTGAGILVVAEASSTIRRMSPRTLQQGVGPKAGPDPDPEADMAISRVEGILTAQQQSRRCNGGNDKDAKHITSQTLTEQSPLLRRNSQTSSTSSSSSSLTAEPTPFLGETSLSRFWLIFGLILAAQFMASFDSTLMASSHPVITSHFKAANSASWLSTAFLLTSTAFQPLLGRLSDAMGRKPLFLACLAIFVVATAWCALAGSIESFVAARAVCGLGAGGAITLGSILTSDLVPIERRGNYQSYVNVTFGAGAALGAALGGSMAEALGWRWEFGVQIPPLLLCIAVSMVVIPDDVGLKGPRKGVVDALREFDFKGSVLLTMSTTFAILGLNFGGNIYPWTHPFVIAPLSIAAVSFSAFIWIESRVSMPIMPLRLIRESPRANLIFSNFIAAVLSNSILFNIPLYFQAVLLSNATSSGLRLVLPSIFTSFIGAITGFAITWTRRLKWPVLSGALWYLAGCIALCFLRRGMPGIVYLLILIPQSIGQGFQFPGTFMAILASSAHADQAVVTSTLILWRCMGLVLGVATSSLVVQNALVYYLNAFVHGEDKLGIIERVRASVEAVAKLEEPYREQVVQSYEASLRLTFILCAVLAAVSVLIVLPIKLPRLATVKRKS
ncbi:major facilitator superfamily domain-containing protein [Trichoderma ceciliae]